MSWNYVFQPVNGMPGTRLRSFIETLCFWVAIVIPFTYLPLFALERFIPMTTLIFICLVIVNSVTLVIGHSHSPPFSFD